MPKGDYRSNRDAVVRAELMRIASMNGGKLEVDIIIEEAKNPENPLYQEYQWDIATAAYEHWRQTTRNLLNRYKIYDADGAKRGLVHVQVTDISDRGYYRSLETVSPDELSRGCRAQLTHAIGTIQTVVGWLEGRSENGKERADLKRALKILRTTADKI